MMEIWTRLFPPPPACWFCSTPVRSPLFSGVKKQICSACMEQFEPISDPICRVCGRRMAGEETEICFDCSFIPSEERICNRSVVAYSDWVKQIMQIYKYRGKESLATPLGLWMAEVVAEQYQNQKFSLITFVPLHEDRLKERGFNQAERLARMIGKQLGLPVWSTLARAKPTSSQSQRRRQERLRALTNVFQLADKKDQAYIKNKQILLIDDVYTTGTTLRECAKPLRQAGAAHVCSVTFAR